MNEANQGDSGTPAAAPLSPQPPPWHGQQGPVQLSPQARTVLRPAGRAAITGGFWADRRLVNAAVSVPAGGEFLERAGNLGNLRLAAGLTDGAYHGDLPFLDSDVYKWLEAVAWLLAGGQSGQAPDGLAARRDDIIGLLAAAQRPDGYLQSWFQVAQPSEPYTNLPWGHELYCAGHLIQAAVAHARGTGRDDLLTIARRFADHVGKALGPGGRPGVGGHPEIETALVELYRCTGEERYLTLASHLIDERGRGLLGDGRFGRSYWQDHIPLRQADSVAGHAVRQLYLLAGAADVCTETGDGELLGAVVRLWEDMVATRTYLTGGVGSHHTDEAFGDPYELPPERAYCETCAAIASVMLSWRLLLITGQARYADLMERTLYNAFLPGVSLDGRGYLYVNPLQVRSGSAGAAGDQRAVRHPWFRCACCPPNIMRLLASLQHYLVTAGPDGLWLCQYASGTFGGDTVTVDVTTEYPWQGLVTVTVTAASGQPSGLHLRVPGWCGGTTVKVNGKPADATAAEGWLHLTRAWQPGDVVELSLPMAARLTAGHPRTDAVRDCVAIERGPLVYCLEQADLPDGARLDDVAIAPDVPLRPQQRPDLPGGVLAVAAAGYLRQPADGGGWWPYRPASQAGGGQAGDGRTGERWDEVELTAIPYFAWANREPGAMRVWLPLVR